MSANLKSCLEYFELFFTQEVWQLLVSQTNLHTGRKRRPAESSVCILSQKVK